MWWACGPAQEQVRGRCRDRGQEWGKLPKPGPGAGQAARVAAGSGRAGLGSGRLALRGSEDHAEDSVTVFQGHKGAGIMAMNARSQEDK